MFKNFFILMIAGMLILSIVYVGNSFAKPSGCEDYLVMTIGGMQNDDLKFVLQDGSGYLLAGETASNTIGDYDVVLIRIGSKGNIVSEKLFGGTKFESLNSIEKTQDNGYILLCLTKSFGTGNSLILKLDSNLNIEWTRTFGVNKIASIQETDDKGYILCGNTVAFGTGDTDAILIKIDETGFFEWSKIYTSNKNEGFISVKQTVDGGYILSGNSNSFDAQGEDVFAMKVDHVGSVEWSKMFTGDGNESAINALKLTDGSYFVIANTYSFGNRKGDIMLVKTDSNGNTLLNKTIGEEGFEEVNFVTQTTDGGVLLTGGTKSFSDDLNGFITKINTDGTIDWTNLFEGKSDDEYFSAVESNGELDAVGWSKSFSSGDIDMLFTKGNVPFNACGCGNILSTIQFKANSIIIPSKNIVFKITDVSNKMISLERNIRTQVATLTAKKICPITHFIKASAEGGGTINPSGLNEIIDGESFEVEITSGEGYKINKILVDGSEIQITNEKYMKYRFDIVTSDHQISAEFLKLPTSPSLITIILQIGKSTFTVNGVSNTLDSPPIIKNNRTLLPIRAVVEALGGTVGWDAAERKVTVVLGSNTIELWIGKSIAKVNSIGTPIDSTNSKVVPEIINSRTMLPLRFVTENLGCDVQWDGTTKTITITYQGGS